MTAVGSSLYDLPTHMVDVMDANGDSEVTADEAYDAITALNVHATREAMIAWGNDVDTDNNGTGNADELRTWGAAFLQ